jgi:hypothetical protein
MSEWILGLILLFFLVHYFLTNNRIKILEAQVRDTEIVTNTLQMNINRLYFFRSIEVQTKDTSLTPESIAEIEQEIVGVNWVYRERNKTLMGEMPSK